MIEVTSPVIPGCPIADAIAVKTISGSGPGNSGSILEATHGGTQPTILASGEGRSVLEVGNQVIPSGHPESPWQAQRLGAKWLR